MRKPKVVIIGSGLAALAAADQLRCHASVHIFTKHTIAESHSFRAQGGIAAVVSKIDQVHDHVKDTLVAGGFHNDEARVKTLVEEGKMFISALVTRGVPFDRTPDGELSLGLEGAHSHRRILHIQGDQTGYYLSDYYYKQVKNDVTFHPGHTLIRLHITDEGVRGVVVRDESGQDWLVGADCVILATGGVGGLYTQTSNSSHIWGVGWAVTRPLGLRIRDAHYIQFHPTIGMKDGRSFGLISEAVRGEGAVLVNQAGERVMKGRHPLGDLAPRDVVSREIAARMQRGERVFLDCSSIHNFDQKFPFISQSCETNHIQVPYEPIPVAPGAHFSMGGIDTPLDGTTGVPGLYAIGEVAGTGVHGANRLASNSLLECIVMGNRCAQHILNNAHIEPTETVRIHCTKHGITGIPTGTAIRETVTEHLGITRKLDDMQQAFLWFESHIQSIERLGYAPEQLTTDSLETYYQLLVGATLFSSAIMEMKREQRVKVRGIG
ncbi:MAG: FAD-binding protein [Bacilli bacterium]